MNALAGRVGPVLGLLYGATFWGLVWYPLRILESAGIRGAWLTLVAYGAAFVILTPLVRYATDGLRRQPWDVLILVLTAGWTNVAFVLAVLDGEVLRVLLLFYLSPIWAALLGHWLLGEALIRNTWMMLGLGVGGALIMLWDPAVGQMPLNRADLLAASSGLAFGLNNVMTRRITGLGVPAKTHLAWLGVVVVSASLILTQSLQGPEAPASAWLGAMILGAMGFSFSTLAVVYGVSQMPVQRSAVIMLFELVVGAVSSWLLAAEIMSTREWIGGTLILGAALIAILREEKRE